MTSDVAIRLAKARQKFQELGDFKKIRTDGLKFAYLPIEAAKPVIEEVTSEQGITIIPTKYEVIPEFTYTYEKASKYDGSKTKWLYQTADITFEIIGPEDSIEMVIRAEAQDNSDKCVNKVYTMAYKNLVKIVFGFAESPKDDGDATQEEVPATAKMTRAEKAAQAGDFFGGSKRKEPTTEAEFVTADSTGKLDAQTRAKMQKAAEGRTKISQFAKDNPDCTIITEAKEAYGDIIMNWADGAVLHVLEALEEVGLL